MRITWEGRNNTPDDKIRQNEGAARRLGLPKLGGRPVAYRLAVVGGGPVDLEAVRSFRGDVWAINRAFTSLKTAGIGATFFSTDALPVIAKYANGAKRAVLATRCHPATFAAAERVETFDLPECGGPTSATAAAVAGIIAGYREIHWYGCASHIEDTAAPRSYRSLLKVKANGQEFLTDPGLILQATHLADVMRAAPNVYFNKSGGLLDAMIADPDVVTLAATPDVHAALERVA